jgi:hypothetical protein
MGVAIGSVTGTEMLWKNPQKEGLLRREVTIRVFKAHLRYRSLGAISRILLAIPFWLLMPTVTLITIWISVLQIQKGSVS